MTYALTVKTGESNIACPDGQRRKAGDQFTVSDREYGLMTTAGVALFSPGPGGTVPTGYLGGTVSHQVTINTGLKNVVLPNGNRYKAGDVVVLTDEEYSTIPAAAKSALFSADTTTLT
jgi:hypothetical protein